MKYHFELTNASYIKDGRQAKTILVPSLLSALYGPIALISQIGNENKLRQFEKFIKSKASCTIIIRKVEDHIVSLSDLFICPIKRWEAMHVDPQNCQDDQKTESWHGPIEQNFVFINVKGVNKSLNKKSEIITLEINDTVNLMNYLRMFE